MPRLPRKAARRTLLLVALTALGVWCATAWGAPTITIVFPDEETQAVDLEQIGAEGGTTYPVRSRRGDKPKSVRVDEYYSLTKIFEAVGASVGYEEVTIGETGEIRLSRRQINDVYPPALYYDEDGDLRFIRGPSGPNDVNVIDDSIDLTKIVQHSESSLRLQASAKDGRDAGEPVVFEVAQSGGGMGEAFKYEWDFRDGGTGSGRRPTHTYDEPGSYRVKVEAVTSDSDGEPGEDRIIAASDTVKVEIGEPKDDEDDQPGSGGTNESTDAPVSGTYSGASGAGSSYGSTSSGSTHYTPPDSLGDLTTDDDPPASTFGDTVEGALLANVSATAPDDATAAAARAARAGDPDFDVPEPDDDVPPAAWAGLGALALVGAGAGLESGRRPRLRRPRLRLSLPRR